MYNGQKMKTIQICIKRWMDKHAVVRTCSGILLIKGLYTVGFQVYEFRLKSLITQSSCWKWEAWLKEASDNFLGWWKCCYLDCGGDYTNVYTYHIPSLCTVHMGAFYCI